MCLIACCISCFLPLLLISIISFQSAQSESKKLNTYVEAECLVIDSFFVKSRIIYSKQDVTQCFSSFNWQPQYLEYESDEQAAIIRSGTYLKSATHAEDQIQKEVEKYEVCMLQYQKCNTRLESI